MRLVDAVPMVEVAVVGGGLWRRQRAAGARAAPARSGELRGARSRLNLREIKVQRGAVSRDRKKGGDSGALRGLLPPESAGEASSAGGAQNSIWRGQRGREVPVLGGMDAGNLGDLYRGSRRCGEARIAPNRGEVASVGEKKRGGGLIRSRRLKLTRRVHSSVSQSERERGKQRESSDFHKTDGRDQRLPLRLRKGLGPKVELAAWCAAGPRGKLLGQHCFGLN